MDKEDKRIDDLDEFLEEDIVCRDCGGEFILIDGEYYCQECGLHIDEYRYK